MAAALAHLACIAIGPRAYRVMGAGERMARAVEAGQRRPTWITLGISAVLLAWAAYALSGAGLLPRLPQTRWALLGITSVYLARALAFPMLRSAFPENSTCFWWVSSGLCLGMGLVHAYGLAGSWERL